MSAKSTGIYHWKLGDIALARVCKRVCAKVQVVKNEDGLFHDEKVLGITADDTGISVTTELCYYVETVRTKQQMWLPYTCMYLAERSRPFYGSDVKTSTNEPVVKTTPKKRKIKEDLVLPLNMKPSKYKETDLNVSVEIRQKPVIQGKYENAFKEFVRLGKEHVFDYFYSILCFEMEKNKDMLDYLEYVDASTEDKFEMVIKNIATEKEIDNYLYRCWRYNFVEKEMDSIKDESENMESLSPLKINNSNTPVSVHAPWCLVCGGVDKLWECTGCPASFHLACRREWLVNIMHRKSSPKQVQKQAILVAKILSSTRTITSGPKEKENIDLCPSCTWGPKVGYNDVVWHKLGTCSWWPARVLTPGTTPPCLLTRNHTDHQLPLKYYGTSNYSWGDFNRICLFMPKHTGALQAKDDMLRQAVLDACDDYIAVYLT